MDDRGRLAQPLKRSGAVGTACAGLADSRARGHRRALRLVRVFLRLPRGTGLVAAAALVTASIGYGIQRGGHLDEMMTSVRETRDQLAVAAGFGIRTVSLSGAKQITREEIFAAAGISERASVLFFDVDAARARIKSIPWVAEATVRKLLPDRLDIAIEERKAFALWQRDGQVSVISADGSVVSAQADRRFASLPFVVGHGAEKKVQAFVALLDHFPSIRDQVRASILVAERRWNLRLTNGLDVRLPERDVEQALKTLVRLDREKKLLSRDIVIVDLRQTDRVTVRLSDAVAQAREEALKDKKTKRRGGDA